MMKNKKAPLRMCIGCGANKDKKDLMRVVKDKEGNISLDFTGKKSGRGAYLCKNMECLKKSEKKKALERAFNMSVDSAVFQELESEFKNIEQ